MEQTTEQQSKPTIFFWKKEITLGQFLGILIALLTAIGTFMYDQSLIIREHSVRLSNLEKSQAEIPKALEKIADEQAKTNQYNQDKQDKIFMMVYELNNKK